VLSILKPRGIKVVGAIPLVRNSVGEDSYVADEVIISRNKLRVRIGNTDAEGRMIMGDVLCKVKCIFFNYRSSMINNAHQQVLSGIGVYRFRLYYHLHPIQYFTKP
jgi:hypothetical protein